jgi:hypothetical protein
MAAAMSEDQTTGAGRFNRISDKLVSALMALTAMQMLKAAFGDIFAAEDSAAEARRQAVTMNQMGAKRIGSLAIGIGVVGIVLNQMSNLDIVANSTGVIDVSGIFQTAGSGLNLLVVGVIIAAAAVLLSLWSGF